MPKKYERKIVVVGKTGNGKSSLANVLIGEREFSAKQSFSAVTTKCKIVRKEKSISVVDTPGLFDSDARIGLVKNALKVQRAVKLCPQPHAFLIVLNGKSRLTEEELLTIHVLRLIFGEQCLEKAVIVLTNIENNLDTNELKRMIGNCEEMSKLIDQCGGRFARIDNTDPRPEHKEDIIKFVDEVSKSGTVCFKNDYIDVHKKALEKVLAGLDSKPVREQIAQLLDCISKAVKKEEKRRYIIDVFKVAGTVVAVCAGGAGIYAKVAAGAAPAVAEGVASIASSQGSVASVVSSVVSQSPEVVGSLGKMASCFLP